MNYAIYIYPNYIIMDVKTFFYIGKIKFLPLKQKNIFIWSKLLLNNYIRPSTIQKDQNKIFNESLLHVIKYAYYI